MRLQAGCESTRYCGGSRGAELQRDSDLDFTTCVPSHYGEDTQSLASLAAGADQGKSSVNDTSRKPLKRVCDLPAPNEPVPLATGIVPVEFTGANVRIDAQVDAALAWRPRPTPTLNLAVASPPPVSGRGPVYAVVYLDGAQVECLVSSFAHERQRGAPPVLRATLRLRGTTDFGIGTSLRRVTFGVVNFTDFLGTWLEDARGGWSGRLQLEAAGWRVVVDQRRDLGAVTEQLEQEGGFAITHVGSLERIDGSAFDIAEADGVLDALYSLFSFARGHTVSLVLLEGTDDAGSRTWWRWIVPSVDAWCDPLTWFDRQRPDGLSSMFETLLGRWSDEGWRRAVQLAVYWYVLALQNASTADSSIVLAFTGLDLVAWFWLVELESKFAAAAFDKTGAAERLRRLLERIGVEPAIPTDLPNLMSHAVAEGWADGPAALAVLRNSAVHPKRRARVFDAPDEALWEASTLATWYLELGLLALLGHEGTYINRVTRRTNYGLEYVPWAVPDTSA